MHRGKIWYISIRSRDVIIRNEANVVSDTVLVYLCCHPNKPRRREEKRKQNSLQYFADVSDWFPRTKRSPAIFKVIAPKLFHRVKIFPEPPLTTSFWPLSHSKREFSVATCQRYHLMLHVQNNILFAFYSPFSARKSSPYQVLLYGRPRAIATRTHSVELFGGWQTPVMRQFPKWIPGAALSLCLCFSLSLSLSPQ